MPTPDRSPPPVAWGRSRVWLPSASEATDADRRAREAHGIPERVLMENAGRSAALLLAERFPEGGVVAAVGAGNNGGDALVLLRTLRAWGREVAWVPAAETAPEFALTHAFEIPRIDLEDPAVAGAGVLVDGVLGTGARGVPRPRTRAVIGALNGAGRPIVALDLPTGVDPDTGAIPALDEGVDGAEAAVRADLTVCFGWPKRGLLRAPGRSRCGRIVAVEIGFPPDTSAAAEAITPQWAASRLPARPFGTHKYQAGSLLVCAGRAGMAGAAILAARAAVRIGAGLVRVVSPEANRGAIQEAVPDALYVPRGAGDAVMAAAAASDAMVVGPALGTEEEDAALLEELLASTEGLPTVLDADALTLMAGREQRLAALASERQLVLTPHPGEFERLRAGGIAAHGGDPVEAAAAWVADLGGTLLLKGAPSVVAAADAPVLVDACGRPDFAKAGMGDHLAGLTGGLLAQGCGPRDAAGVALALSGVAAARLGLARGLSPADLAEEIARLLGTPWAQDGASRMPFVVFDQPEA